MIPDKNTAHRVLIFNITDNMKNAGISELLLNKEFIIKFTKGGVCVASFSTKTDSTSRIIKRITQILKNKLEQEHKVAALEDIEHQIIERHDEIFSIDNNSDHRSTDGYEEYKRSYFVRVTKLKQEHTGSNFSYNEWQCSVTDRYCKLRLVTEKNFPEAWPMLQFCLAVKSILHIDGCTLPFMGVILAIPSSMKTLVIQLFRKYPNSFYSDNFTPNSFESHNASLSEEQLQKIDLLPKLRNKLFLTPELAPIFTTNEDELRKSLGIITRILDGHGLETDSGAQGHRKYGNTFFVWIGAAVEIPYRVWQLLGTLGHKIYFFRPVIPEKTLKELEKIAQQNDFQERFNETEEALLDYLIEVDAAPTSSNIRVDESGTTKTKWNNNNDIGEQVQAIQYIAQIANLQKRLRGTVYVSQSRTRVKYNSRHSSDVSSDVSNDNSDKQSEFNVISTNESDYDTDYPIVEDPSRAVVMLRNLAIGNAISQGRDHINLEDISLILNVALSTTTRARSELVRLLLKKGGELTTSDIVKENKISPPFAKRTMRELAAVGIVDISAVARYSNSELKLTLKDEYSWFKDQDFQKLFNNDPDGKNDFNKNETPDDESNDSIKPVAAGEPRSEDHHSEVEGSKDDDQSYSDQSEDSLPDDCDSGRSQAKTESTIDTHAKNSDACDSLNDNKFPDSNSIPYDNRKLDNNSNQLPTSETNERSNLVSSNPDTCDNSTELKEKNKVPVWGSESFRRVTVTVSHNHTKDDEVMDFIIKSIIEKIRISKGSIVSIDEKLREVYDENERVRSYLGDKLTQRESRKVQKIYLAIIHYGDNIHVVKTKPQITVQWVDVS